MSMSNRCYGAILKKFTTIFGILIVVFSISYSIAWAAKLKSIVLHPDYNHDKFVTVPTDIVKKFRAYITSFDSDDDDDGDGQPDYWGIPHFVVYEIKKFPGTLGKAPKRPSITVRHAMPI